MVVNFKKISSGFTLIEILVAIALIITGVALLINAFVVGFDGIRNAQLKVDALLYAQKAMEQNIMGQAFDSSNLSIGTHALADVGIFSREYEVFYVDSSDLDTEVDGPTDYKRVEVTVSISSGSIKRFSDVELVTIRTNY